MQEVTSPSRSKMGAKFLFSQLDEDSFTSEFAKISSIRHNHPGDVHTYQVDHEEESLIYCTDIMHGYSIDKRIVRFAQGADLLIHYAQYTPDELPRKKRWGHSSRPSRWRKGRRSSGFTLTPTMIVRMREEGDSVLITLPPSSP